MPPPNEPTSALAQGIARIRRRPYLYSAILLVSTCALLKGMSGQTHPYARSQYLYTYEAGFLIRGLPGQLASLVFADHYAQLGQFVEVFSVIACVLLLVALLLTFVRLDNGSATPFALFAIALSGPVLVTLGAVRGYHDALILCFALLAFALFEQGRALWAGLVMLPAILMHELSAVYALPLLMFSAFEHSEQRTRKAAVIAAVAVATVAVVGFGRGNAEQLRLLDTKLAASSSALGHDWRGFVPFGNYAARNDTLRALHPERFGAVLRQPGHRQHLVLVASGIALGIGLLGTRRRYREAAVFAAAALSPHLVYLFAWDYDRLLAMAAVITLVMLLRIVARHRIEMRPLEYAALALVPVQLLLIDYAVIAKYTGGNVLFGGPLPLFR